MSTVIGKLTSTVMCNIHSQNTLATPDATTPTPTSDTSLTLILALGLAHFKS